MATDKTSVFSSTFGTSKTTDTEVVAPKAAAKEAAPKAAGEPTVKKVEPKAAPPDVLLSKVDPASPNEKLPPDALTGVDSAHIPESKVSKAFADSILEKRAWEKEQGDLAAIPDPDKD